MKKLIKTLLCCGIALAGCIATVQAQDLAMGRNRFAKKDLLNTAFTTENTGTKIPASNVNAKALRSFNKEYKDATDMTWFTANKNYVVLFNLDGLRAHVMLGKNGTLYYSVRSGTEKNLPAEVRKLIKSNYVDYAIGTVTEVKVDGQIAWLANIQDENNLVIVRVVDGAIDEVASYKTHIQAKLHKRAHIVIPAQ